MGRGGLLLHKEVVLAASSWIQGKEPYCPKSNFQQIPQGHGEESWERTTSSVRKRREMIFTEYLHDNSNGHLLRTYADPTQELPHLSAQLPYNKSCISFLGLP